MANLLDYLYWRGDLSFDRLPVNEVDHLALCRLSYIPFDGAVPDGFKKDGVALSQAAGIVQAKETRGETSYFHSRDGELLRLMAESVRFGKMRLSGYRNIWNEEAQQQFSAVCIEMENGNCYLS